MISVADIQEHILVPWSKSHFSRWVIFLENLIDSASQGILIHIDLIVGKNRA